MQLSDSSSNVLDGATIDSFVPSSTDLPFDEALAESVQEIAADAGSLAPGISQRRLLLFGMLQAQDVYNKEKTIKETSLSLRLVNQSLLISRLNR